MSKYMMTDRNNFNIQENIETYNKFLEFKKTFLDDGISFFNPDIKLFENDEVFDEFEYRIITNFDASDLKNIEKYKIQLEGASEKVRHFFANIIWFYNYPIWDKKRTTKISELEIYLGEFCNIKTVENSLLENGIAAYGNLSRYIYYDINFIYFFTKQYVRDKTNPNDIINNINLYDLMRELSDEDFKNVKALASKDILNYLFNPDYYEPIVNTTCKKNIVKKFLGKYTDETLDDDIYKIRKETFGFDKSIYSAVCGTHSSELDGSDKVLKRVAQVIDKANSNKDYEVSINPKNDTDEDLLAREKSKMENGLNAEELVYEDIISKTDKTILINKISQIYGIKEFGTLSQNIDELIHYSKNYDKFAPFDLISTRDKDILYIEVKSTTGNEIYFSKNEIKFAYTNSENYQIKVVKDSIIYDIDIEDMIHTIYDEMSENNSWSYETVKFKLEFL